jgi:hypothetical protein
MQQYLNTPDYANGVLFGGHRSHHMRRIIMKNLKNICWTSKRRKVATIVSTVSLVAVTAAAAYFLLLASGDMSMTRNLGTAGTQPIALGMDFAAGLTPGQSEPILVGADNNSGNKAVVNGVGFVVTSTTPGVDGSWFVVHNTSTYPMTLEPNSHNNKIAEGTIEVKDLPTVDQSAAAGAPLTVKAIANPS